MEQKLTDFFPFRADADTSGKFIALSDQQSMSGQFVFNLMLEKYIKEKKTVHIVSVCHKRHHYDAILRKLSIDLVKLEADNMLCIHYIMMPIDGNVKKTYDENIDASNLFINTTINDSSSSTADNNSPQAQAQAIVQFVTNASLDQHTNRVVLIDDLLALDVLLGDSGICSNRNDYSAKTFLCDFQLLLSFKKIHALVVYSDDPVAASHSHGSLAVEAFHGLTAEGDSSSSSKSSTEMCKYRADISVVASKLDSGYSADVHGQLLITSSGSQPRKFESSNNNSATPLAHQQRLLFKTSDVGIRCALH